MNIIKLDIRNDYLIINKVNYYIIITYIQF